MKHINRPDSIHTSNVIHSTHNQPNESIIKKYKIVFLGEASVGKTSICTSYKLNKFKLNQEATVGASFLTALIDKGNDSKSFDIWDTAGQERYKSLAPMYYRGANCILFVFDITNIETYEKAKSWILNVKRNTNTNHLLYILVGNKYDLCCDRMVTVNEVNNYIKETCDPNIYYIEVSAKTGHQIKKLFDLIYYKIKDNIKTIEDANSIISLAKPVSKCCIIN